MNTPHTLVRTACNALHDLPPYIGHHDLSSIVADLAGAVRKSSGLSDKCHRSVIEQLDELADEIDQDLRSQQEVQAWANEQTRAAPFAIPQEVRKFADRIDAANPLETV